MTKAEYTAWKEETARSVNKWQTDLIHRKPEDYLIYKGGTDGHYIHVRDNVVHLGEYEGAIPHIGEAIFKEKGRVECKDNNDAWVRLFTNGGLPLTLDLFPIERGVL